jgi:beta-lactamase class A
VTRHQIVRTAAASGALLLLASCAADAASGQRTQVEVPLDGGHQLTEPEPESETQPAELGPDFPHEQDDVAPPTEPEADLAEPAEGFEEIAERLTELPGSVEALVVEDGEVLLQSGQGEPAPLASVSKIYVLAALVEAIEAGEVDWLDEMELTDELRSLPSGTLQDQPEGYTTTVYDVAHRMISLSDNTGTDMLMALLGRDVVEEAVAESGHHDPQLLRPFLSTRELFQLRWGVPELGEDWEDLDLADRRDVLEEVSEQDMEITSEDTSRHDRDEAIDWYATAEDVAEVTQALAERAQDRPEVGEILTANPGLMNLVQDEWWESLAFKGGGLPGVVTGTWHAQAEDGTGRTVVLLLNTDDTEDMPDHRDELFSLALDALIAGTESGRADG